MAVATRTEVPGPPYRARYLVRLTLGLQPESTPVSALRTAARKEYVPALEARYVTDAELVVAIVSQPDQGDADLVLLRHVPLVGALATTMVMVPVMPSSLWNRHR